MRDEKNPREVADKMVREIGIERWENSVAICIANETFQGSGRQRSNGGPECIVFDLRVAGVFWVHLEGLQSFGKRAEIQQPVPGAANDPCGEQITHKDWLHPSPFNFLSTSKSWVFSSRKRPREPINSRIRDQETSEGSRHRGHMADQIVRRRCDLRRDGFGGEGCRQQIVNRPE